MGAFGAHALRALLPLQLMTVFETAVRYQLLHALALLGCGLLMAQFPGRVRRLRWAAWGFVVGIVLFCGSLYAIVLGDWRWLGLLTPVGGVAWVLAWLLLAAAFWGREPG